ncbi:hypothetical protein LUZ62_018864 [Rhynchospora pubera]|uniref:non-specific serine/threonine protein kinase n=1 Tax=Rhynchospora pubera TaxID=906938 RepID=A0AAV8GTX7_9POAL|nr:hypothetical protein LUZ62_018864 [Rhynchospora pubera]
MRYHLLFLLLLFATSSSSSLLLLIQASPERDLYALVKLKASLVGPTGSGLHDWDPAASSPSHCSFTGVACDDQSRVISLNLSSLPLRGVLAPEIALLDQLVNLTISQTNLTGHLPTEISRLASLKLLNISNNNFNGNFPIIYPGGFLSLEVLDTYNNNFSGPLPANFSNVTKLRHLCVGGNFFSGEIPEYYSELAKLEYLGLNGNGLSGRIPASLGKLSKLKEMYIGYFNSYEGGIPAELGSLTSLVKLDVGGCNLTGPIPASLGQLKNLDTLFLQVNHLTGPIPATLGSLPYLDSLDLSNNELTGEIPASFSQLKRLKLLNLFNNHLRGNVPQFIGELPYLEVLQIWGNNFTGELPESLGRNGHFTKLDVATNHLTGLVPPDLCASGRLELLVLMENGFFGPIPENLGRCNSLNHVRIGKNFLNGTIPPGLFNLPGADMLELNDNYLSGELPPIIDGNMLGTLSLSNNWITGQIPPSIGNLLALHTLSFDLNRLSGSIPSEIGKLKQLSKLNLSGNALSGEIPPELGDCGSISSIDLSRNSLTGLIPDEIATLKILSTLNLSRNQISGEIPVKFVHMTSLTTLDLSFNNLYGEVPAQGQFLVFNESSFAGNPGLCGAPVHTASCIPGAGANSNSGKRVPLHGSAAKRFFLWIGLFMGLLIMLYFGSRKGWEAWKEAKRRRSGAWKMTTFQRLDFTVEDVMECLKEDNIIGKGGAGIVYQGCMANGTELAIKRLVGRGGSEHDRGFTAEITTLGRIRHRNIVRLLGFVSNREANLLLYEYMPNGSLGEMLHGNKGDHLGWEMRSRIAIEAARGLCYLHHDCSPLIIHRDVKSNNILLDSNFEAHVADFGLAKFLHDPGASECMSAIAGSYGYIAPEYAYTLRVDEKSDVYSFGVVLLELVTGRRPVGGFGEGVDIVHWVRKIISELTDQSDTASAEAVADRRLSATPIDLITNLFKVAMRCVEEHSKDRPTMREVVHLLSNPPAVAPKKDLLSF